MEIVKLAIDGVEVLNDKSAILDALLTAPDEVYVISAELQKGRGSAPRVRLRCQSVKTTLGARDANLQALLDRDGRAAVRIKIRGREG